MLIKVIPDLYFLKAEGPPSEILKGGGLRPEIVTDDVVAKKKDGAQRPPSKLSQGVV